MGGAVWKKEGRCLQGGKFSLKEEELLRSFGGRIFGKKWKETREKMEM